MPILRSTTDPENLFLTLSTYRSLSQNFAAGLKARHGLKAGDRVFLASSNSIYTAVVFMGTLMAGGVFAGAQPSFDVYDLSQQIEQVEPTVLLTSKEFRAIVLEATQMAKWRKGEGITAWKDACYHFDELIELQSGENPTEIERWDTILRAGNNTSGDAFVWPEFVSLSDAQQIASLIYSSGTSGQPKGVELTHYQLISNVVQSTSSQTQALAKRSAPTYWTESSPPLGYMSMAQVVGQMGACVMVPSMRLQGYVAPKMDFASVADNVIELEITSLLIHPGFMISLLKQNHMRARIPRMRSLRELVFIGGPVAEQLCSQFLVVWNQEAGVSMQIRFAYGMTE